MTTGGQRRLFRRVLTAGLAHGVVLLVGARSVWAAPGGGTGGYSGGGGGGGGGYSGGGGGGGYSGGGGGGYSGGGGGGSGSLDDMPGWAWALLVVFIAVLILNAFYQQSRKASFDAGGSDWDAGDGCAVTRRALGPRRSQRRKREVQVERAAVEASIEDAAFDPDSVKAATVALHKAIVEAWTARDREALAKLVGPDLMVEWNRRLETSTAKAGTTSPNGSVIRSSSTWGW